MVDCTGEETRKAGDVSVAALWRMRAERSTSSFDISISIFILLMSYLLKNKKARYSFSKDLN
jgi:hypothetical protein